MRTNSGQVRGWRRVVIAGISVGVGYATIGVVGLASGTTSPTLSVYSAVTPVTVLGRSLAAHTSTDVTVADVGSVPSNATSVQLSVTAVSGTTTSSLYVYATGDIIPTSANVRWLTGETVTIPVTVAVGTGGKVRLTTDGGTVTIKVAVVGYFAPAAAPGSVGYASSVENNPIGTGETIIGSVTVPAGTYEVQGKASVHLNAGGTADTVSCNLNDPASQLSEFSYTSVATTIPQTTISVMEVDTTSGGNFTMTCISAAGVSTAFGIDVVAIQLSSATGAVVGG